MTLGISASLSGLNAAATRIAVSADNISRQPILGASKNRVIQSTQDNGGVTVSVQNVPLTTNETANINEYTPSNINFAEEFINQDIAKFSFLANLRALEGQLELEKEVVNIKI